MIARLPDEHAWQFSEDPEGYDPRPEDEQRPVQRQTDPVVVSQWLFPKRNSQRQSADNSLPKPHSSLLVEQSPSLHNLHPPIGVYHNRPCARKQTYSSLSTIWPRITRTTRIWRDATKLVIRNTPVPFHPLPKSFQSLGPFQTCKSRSPQEIRRTIGDNQGKVCLVTELDFFVTYKNQTSERRCSQTELARVHPWVRTLPSSSACAHESAPYWLNRSPTHHQSRRRSPWVHHFLVKSFPGSFDETHTRNARSR